MIISLDETGLSPFTEADWRHRLTMEQDRWRHILASPRMVEDARYLLDAALASIPIEAVVVQNTVAALTSTAAAASMAAVAVLSTRIPQCTVTAKLLDGAVVNIPGGGSPLGARVWFQGLACALIARDQPALDVLCAPPNIEAAQLPATQADSFWPFLCAAAAAALAHPQAARGWLSEAKALLTNNAVHNADPDFIRLQITPLVSVLAALAGEGDWAAVQQAAVESYNAYYAVHGGRGNPDRLLPIVLCGVTALAMDRGIATTAGALPQDLLAAGGRPVASALTLVRTTRFAESVSDPSVLLELENNNPEDRQHAVVSKDGRTLARYRLAAQPGIPPSVIDFVLPLPGEQRGPMPPALDPGERVLAAERFSSSPVNREHLREAIDQIDLVLQSIPPDSDAVPPQAFVNPAGIAAYRGEPGRFHRDRLLAYRDSLRHSLAASDGDADSPPRPTTTSEVRGYAQVVAASKVVKAAVMPLLKQLVSPEGRAAVATLRPRPEDYERVFLPGVADAARRAYESLWSHTVEVERSSREQTDVRISAAPAGMLRGMNELSRHFPSGYQTIAAELRPERVWLAWKYVRPGETSGMAYDGLVWCEDHWAWFPRPYRMLHKK